ncbi:MAG: hypothetical protein CVU05_00475 [Bacteroidetes bacterium HGW-Bacteroidetes-21]|jgi:type IX secretion system PorP/SprF family membrane protein|nr:MAG: hypothetical protein CVU05_00475 [Bacteroidetes bacterium HGW-Bacteroidetes-21]
MIRRIIGVWLVLFFGTISLLKAQDPEFSQFYANPLYLNPALTGTPKCPRANLNYRNQWPALGKTYVTYSASYDQYVRMLEGSIGVLLYQDVQGDGAINTTNISGMYSYTFQVNRNFFLNAAFQASYIQKKLNWNFIFPDMIHPLYGPIYPTSEVLVPTDNTKGHFDFSTGIIGYNREYFFGIAVHHLTQPTESFRGIDDAVLPRKFTLHFGTNIPLKGTGLKKGDLSLSPNLLFQQQQDFQQMNWGLYLNRKGIVLGTWFRQNLTFHYDSFIMLIGYVQDKMKFAYSYDLTTSQLRNQTLGAHEVSFSMIFPCKQRKNKFRTISCPSF